MASLYSPFFFGFSGKGIKWLILPLHESETDRHLIGLSGWTFGVRSSCCSHCNNCIDMLNGRNKWSQTKIK
jgi:hypothetical protein